jgi:hypothetical protein
MQQQAMQQQAMQQQAMQQQAMQQQAMQQQAMQQQVPMTPEQQKATQQAQMTPEQQPAQMTPEQQQAMQQQAMQQKQAYLSGIQGQPAMQQQVPMTPEQQKQAYLSSIQGQQIMGQSNTSTTSIYRGSKVQIPINYQICPPPTDGQNITLVTAVQPSGQCTNPSIQTLTSLGVCVENGYSLVPNGTCPSGPMPQSMREGIFGKMHPLKMKRVNPIKPIPLPQPNCNSYISDASSLLDQISQSINGTLVPSINNILTQNGENSLPSFVKPVNNTTLKKGYLKKSQPRQYGGMKIKRKSPKPPTTKMPPQGTIDMGPMNMGTVSTYSNAIMTYLSGPLTAAINKVGSKLPCPTNVTNQNTATQNTATQNTATQNTPIQENTGNNNQSAGYRRTRRLVMKKRKKSLRRSRS